MKMKKFAFGLLLFAAVPAFAAEPDGLMMPPGFHASVVADGLGPLRHLAVRANGDIYASTGGEGGKPEGLVAIQLGADGKADRIEHFSSVNGGTGITLYHGMLYAASGTAIYRFRFSGNSLLPEGDPETVIADLPRSGNHAIAFDDAGHLFVGLGAKSNACSTKPAPGAKPVGQKPCPDLTAGGGIWRFDANRINQGFADGTQVATGIRFMTAMGWSPKAGLYGIMHGRDGTHAAFPDIVSASDDDAIGDEMHHVTDGTDFGWPYSYYDGARNIRLQAPDYGAMARRGQMPIIGRRRSPPSRCARRQSRCCSIRESSFRPNGAAAPSSRCTAPTGRSFRAAATVTRWPSCRSIA